MKLDGIPEFLRPRLRLFLSVDLVGSTALKQSGEFPIKESAKDADLRDAGAKWVHELASFYRDVEAHFVRCLAKYAARTGKPQFWPAEVTARLWKINGDELIFVQELTSSRECVALLCCWLDACKGFREDLKKKKAKLDVKMAAWTAGFPISNTEVIFRMPNDGSLEDLDPLYLHYHLLELWYASSTEERAQLMQDFIGPQIDTGFRVASKATPRKFMISVEVACVIATVVRFPGLDLDIFFDGQESLRGVTGGKPYPLFWINAHDKVGLSAFEDTLTGTVACATDKAREFCHAYISENDSYMFRPFIYGDRETMLGEIPSNYEEKLRQIAAAWEKAKASSNARDQSLSESARDNGAPTHDPDQVVVPVKRDD